MRAFRLTGLLIAGLLSFLPNVSTFARGADVSQRTETGIHVSTDMALRRVFEAYSWRAKEHAHEYAAQLGSPSSEERLRAVWFLSGIQNEEEFSTLLQHARIESELSVLKEIVEGVWLWLFAAIYEPEPSTETLESCQAYLRRVQLQLEKVGYGKLMRDSFTSVAARGGEAIRMFVEAASERPDPEVWSILAEISFDRKKEDPAVSARARDLVLIWTGLDAKLLKRGELLAELKKPHNLDPEIIVSRLRTFSKDSGRDWAYSTPIGSATWLFRSNDPLRRSIAFRLFLWNTEMPGK